MAKSIKCVYDELVTYDALYKAYVKAKKGKTNRRDVIEFSLNYEYELKKIVSELKALTYTFGEYSLFYIHEPKERKILSAPFRDRIVHTWYVENFLVPYYAKSFMYHSYACIKGIRDLKIYSQNIDGEVYYYRDKSGLECDAVVHLHNGKWGAIEIKLGSDKAIDEAAKNLLKFKDSVDISEMNEPSFLMVLTGTGYAYTREDGVYVVPLGCLKN